MRGLNDRLLEALYVPVERRVLRRLAELTRIYGSEDGEVVIPLTQEDLAGLVGATRPTINQVLRSLESKGMVTLTRGKTIVVDREALIARAR